MSSPNTDPSELTVETTPPPLPAAPSPQSFKCDNCGATFEDEGSAAVHMQMCKTAETVLPEELGKPVT
jgi:hypothetical protein